MKKIFAVFLCILILFSSLISVSASRLLNNGWNSETTLYSPDGTSSKAFPALVSTLLESGWELERENVIVTLYSLDGRTLRVYKSDVDTYLKLGWYKSYDEVVTTLFAPDGRRIKVYKAEKDSYLKVGWYSSYDEVVTTLYAPDGRTLTVYNSEVDTYLSLGWFLKKPIDPSKPAVALTFDDGPNPTNTVRIINTLKKHNVKATFFILGSLADKYPSVVKLAADAEMELANHSYSHKRLTTLYGSGIANEINSAASAIMNAGGAAPVLVRPPYGSHNQTVAAYSGAPLILWSVDTLDWKSRNANAVFDEVMKTVKDGDIILMHDIYGSTADAVELVVPELLKRGFQITTVSELAKAKGITLNNGEVYRKLK